jgi:signal transduction histidine kinase
MGDIWKEIYDSSLKFLVPLDTEETYMVVVNEAIKLVGGKHASIFLWEKNKLKRAYTTYDELNKIELREDGITNQVFRTRVPNLRHKDDLVAANKVFLQLSFYSDISVPLIYGHITLGVLSVLSAEGKKFDENDLHILKLFAPVATLAIRKTQYIQEAEEAIEARNLFLSIAEHEIRNPLAAISLYAESLKNKDSIKKLPEYKSIKKLEIAAKRLTNLVTELLQSHNPELLSLKYNFARENIVSFCRSVVYDLSIQYPSHKLLFRNKEEEVYVSMDKEKMREVINNLIDNAVKFSSENTEIIIRTKLLKERNEVLVSVEDKGVGISKENLPKVFKQFYRGTSSGHGVGIGLYLVKEIITRHKGKIKIKSTLGKGTIVTINLPIERN